MKRLITLLNLLFIANSYPVEPGCFKYLKTIISTKSKMLKDLASHIDKNLVKESIYLEDLENVFNRLKQEEETYNSTYLNRSSFKKELQEDEVQFLRASFKLEHLSEQELQDFYINEVYKLYLYVDHSVTEYFAQATLVNHVQREDSSDILKIFILAYQGMRSQNDIKGLGASFTSRVKDLEELTPSQVDILTEAYHRVRDKQIEQAKELLKASDLSHHTESLISQFQRARVGVDVCCKSAGGCYFCPNNLGLKLLNATKRDNDRI